MADIFLSYANEDRARARRLAEALESSGWSVWWDHEIPPGKTWAEVIKGALDEARIIVVLWSRTSVESRWVQKEARYGLKSGDLVPVLIDDVEPPFEFEDIQSARLFDWDEPGFRAGFQRLAEGIQGVVAITPGHGRGEQDARLEPSLNRPEDSTASAAWGPLRTIGRLLWHEATLIVVTAILGIAAVSTGMGSDGPPTLPVYATDPDRLYYSDTGSRDQTRLVVREPSVWANVWARTLSGEADPPPRPPIDFDTHMILLVAHGPGVAGDRIAVDSLRVEGLLTADGRREERLLVWVTTTMGCDDLSDVTFPTEIARVPRFDGEVLFDDNLRECSG